MGSMRRLGALGVGLVLAGVATIATGGASAAGAKASPEPVKINVMGEWAHPDDDTSIIGPCGVWHQRYGIRCGIIMVTRGEGGGNAVGTEIGPALGLRRENEDRVAHYRSGTVDIFNLDRVDFFYNQSAPVTQFFWEHDETLARVTRVIRMTKPDIYIGFTPTLGAGHGHHQQAGRYIWEDARGGRPVEVPGAAVRAGGARDVAGEEGLLRRSTAGTGGTTTAADCTTGFVPAATNLDTVAGVWTGYPSPASGLLATSRASRAERRRSGSRCTSRLGRIPDAEPRDEQGDGDAELPPLRHDAGARPVPAEHESGRLREPARGARRGDPLRRHDPGSRWAPARDDRVPDVLALLQRAGHGVRGDDAPPPRAARPLTTVALSVPTGWTVDAPKTLPAVPPVGETTVTFTVTPAASAAVNANYKISALVSSHGMTGYTDNVVRLVPPVEGRFHRWGKWAEYDEWLEETAPAASGSGDPPRRRRSASAGRSASRSTSTTGRAPRRAAP